MDKLGRISMIEDDAERRSMRTNKGLLEIHYVGADILIGQSVSSLQPVSDGIHFGAKGSGASCDFEPLFRRARYFHSYSSGTPETAANSLP